MKDTLLTEEEIAADVIKDSAMEEADNELDELQESTIKEKLALQEMALMQ
jgi:hypothetical protein